MTTSHQTVGSPEAATGMTYRPESRFWRILAGVAAAGFIVLFVVGRLPDGALWAAAWIGVYHWISRALGLEAPAVGSPGTGVERE